MSQFSIIKALRFSFFSYAQYFGLLVCAGVLLTGLPLLLEKGSEHLAVYCGVDTSLRVDSVLQQQGSASLMCSVERKGAVEKVKEGVKKITTALRAKKKLDLAYIAIFILLSWLLQTFFSIGVMKIALTIRDGKQPYFLQLLEGYKLIARWVGAIVLMELYVLRFAVIFILPFILFPFIIEVVINNDVAFFTTIAGVCGAFAIVWKYLGYTLFKLVLVDTPTQTARGALEASQNLLEGSRRDLMRAFVVLVIVQHGARSLLVMLMKKIGLLIPLWPCLTTEAIGSAFAILTASFGSLFLASVYRDLTQPWPVTSKQSA